MFPTPSSSHVNRVLCIDPRILHMNDCGVPSPIFEDDAQQIHYNELVHDVDNALADVPQQPNETHERALASPSYNAYLYGTSPAASAAAGSRQSSLRPDAQEFVPRGSPRPQLTLSTATQEPAVPQQVLTTPTTPRINVLPPADCSLSSNVRARRTSQSRGRARRRSSPARRPSQSLAGRSTPAFRIEPTRGSGNALLSPIRAEAWVADSYHPGDRFPLKNYPNAGPMPANQQPGPGMAQSPSSLSNQRSPPFYCDYEDCKLRDKAWDMKSELRKHQKTHQPKAQRPHVCPHCTRRFQYPKDVARHVLAKHQEGKPVCCQYCNKFLSRDDNLQRHMQRVHGIMPTPNSAVQTPSTAAIESSVTSPVSPSVSNYSDMMYSDTSPSTTQTSPWSQVQGSSRLLQHRLLLPAKLKGPVFGSSYGGEPMTRGHTN